MIRGGFASVGFLSAAAPKTMSAFQAAQPRTPKFAHRARWPRGKLIGLSIKECVSYDQIARRIADPRASEVDHGAELALLHQKIACGNVAMDPHRRPLPRRCECRIQTSVTAATSISPARVVMDWRVCAS